MSDRRLRELQNIDVTIASHGIEHVPWPMMGDEQLRQSLEESLEWVTAIGGEPHVLAYPDGAVDARVADILAHMGVRMGFSLETVAGVPAQLSLPRQVPNNDPNWMPEVER